MVKTAKTMIANGRSYEIVAEYEVITYRTAQSYIRAIAFVSNWHGLKVEI